MPGIRTQSCRMEGAEEYPGQRSKNVFKGPFPASFFFIFFFSLQLTITNVLYKRLPMTGFELWTSGVRSNHSTNWATTTAIKMFTSQFRTGFCLVFKNTNIISSWYLHFFSREFILQFLIIKIKSYKMGHSRPLFFFIFVFSTNS